MNAWFLDSELSAYFLRYVANNTGTLIGLVGSYEVVGSSR